MKAAIRNTYGGPQAIEIVTLDTKPLEVDEVLIKVHASSLNYADNALLTGKPFLVQIESGLFKPKNPRIGSDVSGVIEEVGASVIEYEIGDHVIGDLSTSTRGAFAEYYVVKASEVIKKPKTMDHTIAACLPLAGITALQGLRDVGQVKKGSKVLINGASGSVGSIACEIAKAEGAIVDIICHKDKMKHFDQTRYNRIIDYTTVDITKETVSYDIILDCAAYNKAKSYNKILADDGTYICVGGSMKTLFSTMLLGPLLKRTKQQKYKTFLAKPSNEDLKYLVEMVDKGLINILIDSEYPLSQIRDAATRYQSRAATGKIVITM